MSLAKAVGLKVSAIERFEVGDKVCILIQRYDRTAATDGTVTRIHQEDFCQALGFPPEHKYQQEGGPLLRDCVALLRERSTAPVLDIRDFIDGQIFNVLVGNADAHGKNYSMLYQDGQRRLAPFYDLVCTLAWPELSKTPAMKIGGSPSLDVFTAAPWQKMAQESRLGWPMIRERIEALCTKATDALRGSALCEVMTGQMEERVAAFAQERASNFLSSRPFSRDIGSWKLLC